MTLQQASDDFAQTFMEEDWFVACGPDGENNSLYIVTARDVENLPPTWQGYVCTYRVSGPAYGVTS